MSTTSPTLEPQDNLSSPLTSPMGMTPDVTPTSTASPDPDPKLAASPVTIVAGYRPGIVGAALTMHLNFYSKVNGWGIEFETSAGKSLCELMTRLHRPKVQAWSAVRTVSVPTQNSGMLAQEQIVGVVFVDGECLGEEGVCRLRAFIVDESARGLGAGKALFGAAMDFAREMGFRECRLSTMASLLVARKMYEKEGFEQVSEEWSETWGVPVMQLHYVWRRDRGQG
ncbi:acyl-CoA N-acyltransferase [Podospora appendiculata]|uniref:Acyl-CoA N-acyltransferase n=1 Tax=Podospora appendiculata TaxID=314037 RepID=A0AAE0XL81_9PEZI|nr:acyl-CoA N-acyltransferase [Podospora appendiculata]